MIEVKQLSKNFGKKKAVTDISYTFNSGIYGLLGPNGAGKTTWIRCMLELCPHKGQVIFTDSHGTKKDIRIGYLPQRSSVFPGLTVEEHIKYFAYLKHLDKREIAEETDRVLDLVNLTDYKKKRGNKLSGGMIRRLGIAQALLGKPNLIIFDEPTTGLDPEERLRFKNIMKKAGKDSVVIMSTHIVEDVEAVCDKILIMKDGRILAHGTQEQINHIAEGKVYVIPKSLQLPSHYVERELLTDGVETVRILTGEPVEAAAIKVVPSIEDGYLCILKGI